MGCRAANYLQNIGPQDGSEFIMIVVGLPLSQVLGVAGVKFDLTKFNWIGNMSQSPNVVIAWHTTQVRTLEDAREKELVLAGDFPFDTSTMTALFANSALGINFVSLKDIIRAQLWIWRLSAENLEVAPTSLGRS